METIDWSKKQAELTLQFYDIPLNVDATQIQRLIKDKAEVTLDRPVSMRTEQQRNFRIAYVTCKTKKDCEKILFKLRYPCFKTDVVGPDGKNKFVESTCMYLNNKYHNADKNAEKKNVFVKNIPKDMTCSLLHILFQKFGTIISLRIKLNDNYDSLGQGFVCFEEEEAAAKAIEAYGNSVQCTTSKFIPKDQRQVKSMYVENFPEYWTEEELREVFEEFGVLSTCALVEKLTAKGVKKRFAIIVYDSSIQNLQDQDDCCLKAYETLNGKSIEGVNLVVKPPLTDQQREEQKQNSTNKYALYVKDLPKNLTNQELREYFSQFGEIKKAKVFEESKHGQHGIVIFKKPSDAHLAKAQCKAAKIKGKRIYVDFYQFQDEKQQSLPIFDAIHKLTSLLMPSSDSQSNQSLAKDLDEISIQSSFSSISEELKGQIMHPGEMPKPKQVKDITDPFLKKTLPLLDAIVEENPKYQEQVGSIIFQTVEKIVGADRAPKITGMLINLPINEIRDFMQDYEVFKDKLRKAKSALKKQNKKDKKSQQA